MSQTAIEAQNLVKTFRDSSSTPIRAVDGVSLRVEPGEIIGLLGPNGAGKSTLIDMLLGLTMPASGTVRIFGTTPRQAMADARIGAVLQTGGLLPNLSVRNTIRMIAATHRHPLAVDEALHQANLDKLAERQVSSCSGGEQQRLRFALAILPQPDILILDEPTAGMDALARHAFWKAMEIQAQHGRSILFATHYIEEAQDFAQRIVVISGGRIIADGPTAEIREKAAARTLRTILPQDLDALAIPGVLSARKEGAYTVLTCADSDALARHLLTHTDARELSISPASLEEAFLALTSGAASSETSPSPVPSKAQEN